MQNNEPCVPLCTVYVQPEPEAKDHPYRILLAGRGVLADMRTLENAIDRLRQRGEDRATIVNGTEVYVLAWGPTVVPLEEVLW